MSCANGASTAVQWTPPQNANLDAQTRDVLDAINASHAPNLLTLPPAERRRVHEAFFQPLGLPPSDLTDAEDRSIPGPRGPIRVRIYRPRPTSRELRPALVYYHGGGMTAGSIEQYDPLAQRLSQRSGAIVVSVDYRLSPEHRFPEPVDDAYAAYVWVHNNAASLGIDSVRLGIGGDSAGGNLAAAVTHLTRDRHGPPIKFQLLVYPAVADPANTPSGRAFANGYLFGLEEFHMTVDEYAPTPQDRTDPRLFPLLNTSFAGLPPAFIISCGYEIMRDDIESYARRLAEAGVSTELHRYSTTIHAFLSMAGAIDLGRHAIDECADRVRAGLSRVDDTP